MASTEPRVEPVEEEMVTIRARHKKTGEVTIMRVKKGTPMGDVFKQYAEKKGLEERALSFVAGGKRISNDAKPMDLKKQQNEKKEAKPEEAPEPEIYPADDLGCSCFG